MAKPKPTKQLVLEECGANHGLTVALHHGLAETSALKEFYPFLGFDELVAFAASSWKTRKDSSMMMNHLASDLSLYGLFSEVYHRGFPWLNANKNISDNNEPKHQKMNPFLRVDLESRLDVVDSAAEDKLRHQLLDGVNEYVFEINYNSRKIARGTNHKLVVMTFQGVYPNRDNSKNLDKYAAEIARIIKTYPTNIANI